MPHALYHLDYLLAGIVVVAVFDRSRVDTMVEAGWMLRLVDVTVVPSLKVVRRIVVVLAGWMLVETAVVVLSRVETSVVGCVRVLSRVVTIVVGCVDIAVVVPVIDRSIV